MTDDFDEIIDEEVKEEVDYVSLGKAMRKIRTSAGKNIQCVKDSLYKI